MSPLSFFKKITIFLLPIAALFAFPLFVMVISGELVPLDKRIEIQQASQRPVLLTKAYFPFEKNIRQETFVTLRPDITTIGNSRVYQFREEFFKDDNRFYNFSDGGAGLEHVFNTFWQVVDRSGATPKLVIVGLEQSMFIGSNEAKPPPEKPNILYIVRRVYGDYWSGKLAFWQLIQKRRESDSLGISALVSGGGTRKDGSERYGAVIAHPLDPSFWDYKFRGTFERIDGGIPPLYMPGADLSPVFLTELKEFLDEAKRRGIHVVGFLPPYAPSAWNRMKTRDDHYAYILKINPAVGHEFADRGFSFFDLTNASLLASPDEEFLDGNHGSEKTHARMVLYIAERDPIFAHYADVERIKRALKESKNNLEIFR